MSWKNYKRHSHIWENIDTKLVITRLKNGNDNAFALHYDIKSFFNEDAPLGIFGSLVKAKHYHNFKIKELLNITGGNNALPTKS
mgnify:CR=1 FL=1